MQQWAEIVSLFEKKELMSFNSASLEEEKIEGVTHYLNGQTSFEETGF